MKFSRGTLRYFASFFALSFSLILVSSCNRSKDTNVATGNKNQILHFGNGTEVQDIDPHVVTGVPEHHIIAAIFEGLVNPDPVDLHPVPGVAESWVISKDQKQYTFKLRQNAKWSNGDPVTAKDFVYGWRRILTPTLGAEYAYMLHYVKNAKAFNEGKIKDFSQVGVKAVDDHTLVVQLESPTPFFLYLLQHYSSWPVHQASLEKFGGIDQRGTKWTRPENIVTNGPFLLKRWELNKILVVEKNPTYWDAATVRLNAIHFYPTDSDQTEERMFRSGALHITNTVPLNKIEVYKKNDPNLISITPYLGTYFYRINVTKPALNKKEVRQALNMSINRQAIVEKVTKAGQIPATSFVPPDTVGYTTRAKVEYNPEKARELLAKGGYPGGKDFPKIEILYNTNEGHKVIAEAVQEMWKKELGISVGLTNQDWKVYLDTEKRLAHDISRAGWIGDYPDPNTFLDLFMTNNGNNRTGWSNKTYDQLIMQAAQTGDMAKRFEIFQKAEAILLEELPIIPVYIYTRGALKHPSLKGWYPNILDQHPYKHVYLEDNTSSQH